MPDYNINVNINNNAEDFSRDVKKAEKATEEFNDELKDTAKAAKKAEKEIKDVSKAADKLGKSAKLGKLGLEALKDNLGALPIAGQTLSRALDDVEGSFLSIAKAALPIAGVAGGLAAVGASAVLAYKNSEKLQESIGRLGTEVIDLGTNLPIFESIGDAVAVVTDNIADVIHNMNILNGNALANTKKVLDEINKSQIDINKQEEIAIEKAKARGASEEEILRIRQQYAGMRIDTAVDNKSIAPDEYVKQNEEYDRLYKIREKLINQQKQFDENNAMEAESYYSLQTQIDHYTGLIDKQSEVMDQSLKANRQNNEIIEKSAEEYKELGNTIEKLKTVEGARSTDKNKRDELKEAREQLKALKEEQEILNDTVLDGAEAEEKRRSDLQAQLPLLEKIYILEEQRGIANSNTLKDIKSTKAFLEDEESEVEKLKAAYDDLVESQNIRDALINSSNSEEARQKEIQDTQAQLTALENLYEAQVKAGEPAEKTLETIKQLKDYLEDITKETYNWKDNLTAALSITSSIGNLFGSAMTAALDFSQIDLAPFDKAIEEAQAKLDAFNKWKEEQEEAEEEKSLEDYEERIALLDEEIEYAKEIGDKMSEIALENKKKEIQKEMDEEQKRIDKEKAINEEEKRLEHELALAEYHKEYANWQNQVKSAQTQKTKAIADSIIMPAQAIGNAAIGISQAFAQGGLVGLGLGLAASTGVIASAVSGAAGVKNASSALDSIQGNPPQPPQFQFGTTSYNVAAGESILVGEAGPELLSLKSGGNIAVESNAQVKAKGLLNNGDIYR